MTDRDITGDAARSSHKAALKTANEVGLTDEQLGVIAAGVREFDAERSAAARQTKALEKIASNTQPPRERQDSWEWEERRLRRREVYAQELMAVAVLDDDVNSATLDAIRQTPAFQRLVERLTREPNASTPDSATP